VCLQGGPELNLLSTCAITDKDEMGVIWIKKVFLNFGLTLIINWLSTLQQLQLDISVILFHDAKLLILSTQFSYI